jgi:predicted DNA-binding transcriptional regulator AlpA
MPETVQSSAVSAEIIRGWRGVSAATGKSRVQIWRDIRAGRFPAPVELGPNSIGWYRNEIDAWITGRPRRMYRAG